MRSTRDDALFVVLGGAAAVLLSGVLIGIGLTFDRLALPFYSLAVLLVFGDTLDLLVRLIARRLRFSAAPQEVFGAASVPLDSPSWPGYRKQLEAEPWAIIGSVYSLVPQMHEFVSAFGPWRERVWLIDDASSDGTADFLRSLGFRCESSSANRKKPAALRRLLSQLPPEIETVLVIDPDCEVKNRGQGAISDLEQVVFDFQRSTASALCPRVRVAEDTLLGRLQTLEYDYSFSWGRASLAEFTVVPGVALYRRADLEAALAQHSLSVYAEDLETSVLLLSSGKQIYYDERLTIQTEGKRSLREWFSQRVGWSYGLVKVYWQRRWQVRRIPRGRAFAAYQYWFYTGVLSIAMIPIKMLMLCLLGVAAANGVDALLGLELIPNAKWSEPMLLLVPYAQYTLLTLLCWGIAVPREDRRHLLPVVPLYFFYAVLSIVPLAVGALNWIGVSWFGRRLWDDHFESSESLRRNGTQILSEVLE